LATVTREPIAIQNFLKLRLDVVQGKDGRSVADLDETVPRHIFQTEVSMSGMLARQKSDSDNSAQFEEMELKVLFVFDEVRELFPKDKPTGFFPYGLPHIDMSLDPK